MATFTKQKLSSCVDGKAIKIAAVASPGTLIHTSVAGTINWDEVWLYVTNNHTAAVGLLLQWGGVASPDDLIQLSVPSKSGLYLVVPGLVINNGLLIRAYAVTANVLTVSGWVNRITS
jgi:hypothetical protein